MASHKRFIKGKKLFVFFEQHVYNIGGEKDILHQDDYACKGNECKANKGVERTKRIAKRTPIKARKGQNNYSCT